MTHTSSVTTLVPAPSAAISQDIVSASFRSRLLYPDCPGSVGNIPISWARA
jgi:hypothetical protein